MRVGSFLIFFLVLGLLHVSEGRPNPVPDEAVDIMEKYEKDHARMKDIHRVKRHRRYRSEDPEDQEVVDELPMFHKIRRRNLDKYPVRHNIFQEIIDKQRFDHDPNEDYSE